MNLVHKQLVFDRIRVDNSYPSKIRYNRCNPAHTGLRTYHQALHPLKSFVLFYDLNIVKDEILLSNYNSRPRNTHGQASGRTELKKSQ